MFVGWFISYKYQLFSTLYNPKSELFLQDGAAQLCLLV